MSIFDGIGDLANRGDLPYLRSIKKGDTWDTCTGGYLLTLQRLEQFKTKDGQGRVTAEFRVTQVTSETPTSHAQGAIVKEMWNLDRNLNKELTGRGKADMRRASGFFAALLIQAGIETTPETIGDLCGTLCDAAMTGGDGNPIGMQVLCDVYNEESRSDDPKYADNKYASTRFSAPPQAAAA